MNTTPATTSLTPQQKAARTRHDRKVLAAREALANHEPADVAIAALATFDELEAQHAAADGMLAEMAERSMTPEGWTVDMLQSKSEALATIMVLEGASFDLEVPVAGPAADSGSEDDPMSRVVPGTIAWSVRQQPGMSNHPHRIVPAAAELLGSWVTAHTPVPGPINPATGKPRWTNKEFHNLAVYFDRSERDEDREFPAKVALHEDEQGIPGLVLFAAFLRPQAPQRAQGKVAMLVAMFPKPTPMVDFKSGEITGYYPEIGYSNPEVRKVAWQSAGIVRFLDQDQLDGFLVQAKAHNAARRVLTQLDRQASENLAAAEHEAYLASIGDDAEVPAVRSSQAAVDSVLNPDSPF